MKNKIKLCIGPMSKLVVDAVLDLEKKDREKLAFIPSRRQIEHTGGYVNNWTTEQFSKYISNRVIIQRDHGGPGQGSTDDDGMDSYRADGLNFDLIHIDPWKKYGGYKEGVEHTANAIENLYKLNPNLKFEIGTEESIRRFSEKEFESLISDLKTVLNKEHFNAIRYAVVQSGVGLDLMSMKNTGTFSAERLKSMVKTCKENNLLSKEHNGDYLTTSEIKNRFDIGLDAINIAPEFGQIQTKLYIEHMNQEELKQFYNICYNSGKWKKWVNEESIKEEKDIIKVCGHYVFSNPSFKNICPRLDSEVISKVQKRIKEIKKI